MFCHLERIELKTSHCPVESCMYRDRKRGCAYESLSIDGITAQEIADVKGVKVYKAKFYVNQSKEQIAKGIVVLKYATFIKDSYPAARCQENLDSQTVNDGEDQTSKVLEEVFELSKFQREKFLDNLRYSEWAARSGTQYTLRDLKEAVLKASESLSAQ